MMARTSKVSDEELLRDIKAGLSLADICRAHNLSLSGNIYSRVEKLSAQHGIQIRKVYPTRNLSEKQRAISDSFQSKLHKHGRQQLSVTDGVVLIGSDAHFWPGIESTAFKAFCLFAREMRPSAVILNGDGFDGASISRHPRIGWDSKPTVKQELDACKEFMGQLEEASGTKRLYWPLGNHDSRFETFLAANAPEFQGVDGFHLKDACPLWIPCWSVFINENTVVKHRFKSGIHAPHNNAMWAGRTMVTGHLHSHKVMPLTNYGGTHWGVACGMLAQAGGPQFTDYLEDNPVNWRSGFVVLTYWKGDLLTPEMVRVYDEDR